MSLARAARWLVAAGLVALIGWSLLHRDAISGAAVEAWLADLGPWAAPAFVLVYVVGALVFLPGSVMTLAGGAVFGPVLGTLLSLSGATIGAAAAFSVSRALGGKWVEQRVEGRRLGRIVRGIEDDGWRFVAFVRLVPVFPYNALNYALGLTRISLVQYVVVSAICMAPGAAAFTYVGYAGREALHGPGAALQAGLLGLGLLATVIFVVPRIVRRRWATRSTSAPRARTDS